MTSSTELEINVTSSHSSRNSCSLGSNSRRKKKKKKPKWWNRPNPLSHCRVAAIPNSESQQLLGWSGYFGAISRENFDSLGSQFNLIQNCYNLVGEYPRNTNHLSCFKTSHSLINNSCISCMIFLLFCCCRGSQLSNRGSKSKLTYSQSSWHHWWKCLWCLWWSKRHQKKNRVGLCCVSKVWVTGRRSMDSQCLPVENKAWRENVLRRHDVPQFMQNKRWTLKIFLTLRTCICHLYSSNGWITYYIKIYFLRKIRKYKPFSL